jgi:prepilin-type processing-associated H-X9-DG protein/prepilin-type N-terminal cleavage/methylation domain-containing protein
MKNKNAFTLTELLVVIAIIALLLAVLMPVIGTARNCAKAAACQSNLRQFLIAAATYAAGNNGFYPPAHIDDPDPFDPVSIDTCWDFIHITDLLTGREKSEPGLLWSGQIDQKVQQCPAYRGPANSDDPYTGYNYNISYIGRGTVLYPDPVKVDQVKNPAGSVIFGDGQYYDGANKYMRSPFPCLFDSFVHRAAGTQGFRHNGRTNVAWCDGHVSSQKEYYTQTIPGEKILLDEYNARADVKIGFLSPDNSAYDLK